MQLSGRGICPRGTNPQLEMRKGEGVVWTPSKGQPLPPCVQRPSHQTLAIAQPFSVAAALHRAAMAFARLSGRTGWPETKAYIKHTGEL